MLNIKLLIQSNLYNYTFYIFSFCIILHKPVVPVLGYRGGKRVFKIEPELDVTAVLQ